MLGIMTFLTFGIRILDQTFAAAFPLLVNVEKRKAFWIMNLVCFIALLAFIVLWPIYVILRAAKCVGNFLRK